MATMKRTEIIKWLSDDGKEYSNELEALKADVEYWKEIASVMLIKDEIKTAYNRASLKPELKVYRD